MINDIERQFLQKTLAQQQQQLQYYLVLAVILLLLAWGLFFALKRNGMLLIAAIMSIGIWYYPWTYYQKIKSIKQDLETKKKLSLTTTIYSKRISKINKVQPYYYIYTEEEDFEVTKAIYQNLSVDQTVRIAYTPISKTILDIEVLTE